MKKYIFMALWLCSQVSFAQKNTEALKSKNQVLDSIFVEEIEKKSSKIKPKVLHAEPLYIDLIRDLGARKGEKEWNLGMGMQDMRNYDVFQALVEYEWAPINRLGFEVELPLSLYSFRDNPEKLGEATPANRLESLKMATQYTFLVSEKRNLSMAIGYIHEFELNDLNLIGKDGAFRGNVFNPFFVAAKRWDKNYHSLLYTGPKIEKNFDAKPALSYEINWSFHYMVSGTRNFIGLEINQEILGGKLISTLRPQMRLGLAENLMVGIVSAIPICQVNTGLGSFLRIIYEPGFRALH